MPKLVELSMRGEKRFKNPAKIEAPKLLVHTAIGAVMGLVLGVLLLVLCPSFAALLERQGLLTVGLFSGMLILTFAIGATVTGVLLMGADR
jgi:hypothetical protein